MHVPKSHRNDNPEELKEFISQNGFGILVNQLDGKFWATHIPLVLDKSPAGNDVLLGHISRGNPQWRNFADAQDVLAIFHGPHAYISSSWYDHENVPTWNYIAVHVYGKIKILEEERLLQSLKDLVHKYEVNSKNPVSVERMSEHFIKKEIKGIIGFEIVIEEMQAAYKLSQNRDEKNYNNIITELESQPDASAVQIAKAMKERGPVK